MLTPGGKLWLSQGQLPDNEGGIHRTLQSALTSPGSPASLSSDKGPSEATQGCLQLPPIHFSWCSHWKAARRNKLETKEDVDILPGRASSPSVGPCKEIEPEVASQSRPPFQTAQTWPRRGPGIESASTKKRPSVAMWQTLLNCNLERWLGQTGHHWRVQQASSQGWWVLRSTFLNYIWKQTQGNSLLHHSLMFFWPCKMQTTVTIYRYSPRAPGIVGSVNTLCYEIHRTSYDVCVHKKTETHTDKVYKRITHLPDHAHPLHWHSNSHQG
jgi:hypothetical protein